MNPSRFHKYGIGSLLIEWEPSMNVELISIIAHYSNQLKNQFAEQIIDLVPAYHSLLVQFNYKSLTHDDIITILRGLPSFVNSQIHSNHWKIPVDYSEQNGIDLDYLSDQLKLSKQEIIDLHSNASYHVHFIGFLPGFPYLSGLDKRLHCPRRSNPRTRIPVGAVAIGGSQTGIYPLHTPGGWHIIGHTDFQLFHPAAKTPCPLKAGDTVQFIPRQYASV